MAIDTIMDNSILRDMFSGCFLYSFFSCLRFQLCHTQGSSIWQELPILQREKHNIIIDIHSMSYSV